jgi:hypothetical protein
MLEQKHDHPVAPQRLDALDIDLAPDLPGIYAWYARLALSRDDWRARCHGDLDLAARDLDKAVADYAHIHQPEPLELRGDGSYGLNWFGTIRQDSISEPSADGDASRVEVQLGELSSDPSSRRLFIQLLLAATPIFASPLYIGVATSLRSRLAEHKADYEGAKTVIRNNPSASARLQFGGESFGARLAGCGIQLERLECWILPTIAIADQPDGDVKQKYREHRSVARTAEWVLQRIFQPVLGRK